MKKLSKKTQKIVEGSPFYHLGWMRGMLVNMKTEIIDYGADYQQLAKWKNEMLEHLKKAEELIEKTI